MERPLESVVEVQCSNVITGCSNCITPNICGGCTGNNIVSWDRSSCITAPTTSATVENCAAYLSPTTCNFCYAGFQLLNNQCITCQVSGCSVCSSNNFCSVCMRGYNPPDTSGQCSVSTCQYPCKTCLTNQTVNIDTPYTNCLTCYTPFSSNAATNGTCYTCTVANCQTCSIDTATSYSSICSACYAPYVLNGNTCVLGCNSDYCSSCSLISGSYLCGACYPGYVLLTTNTCLACSGAPICATCTANTATTPTTTTCATCIPGYYIVGGNCASCYPGCATCTGNLESQCLTFLSGNTMMYQNNTIALQPVKCDQGCQTCLPDDPSSCISCSLGYYWTDYICLPCNPSCATCAIQNPATCLSCYSNGFFNQTSSSCSYCNPSSNCLTCLEANTTNCTSCPLGYMISGLTQQCTVLCPQNCLTCYYPTTSAQKAISG